MFGKILVFLHFALSLMFATWALVLYTNRIDWTDNAGKGGRPAGELVARKDEYQKLVVGGVRPADVRFRVARARLVMDETRRPIERAWYVQQLEFLNSLAKEDNPARQIAREKDGGNITVVGVVLDKDGKIVKEQYPPAGADLLKMGPPQDKDGNPLNDRDGKPLVLRSLAFYNKEFNSLLAQETAEMKRRNQFAEQDKAATEELKGEKGLHARIRREAHKQELMMDEYAEVRPLWLNTKVELLNLKALAGRLAQRQKELLDMKSLGNKLGQ